MPIFRRTLNNSQILTNVRKFQEVSKSLKENNKGRKARG